MADNFNMKQFLMENKLGAYSRIKEVDETKETDEAVTHFLSNPEEDSDDFDLNHAFKMSPRFHSYDEVLDIFKSYGVDEVIEDFKSQFPEGEDIDRSDYMEFAMSMADDMSEAGDIQANWISISDPDIYDKAGLYETEDDTFVNPKGQRGPTDLEEDKDKEEKQFGGVNEVLSPQSYERMYNLSNIKAQQAMIRAAEVMMNELTAEGFEVEEIREFFTKLIANDI